MNPKLKAHALAGCLILLTFLLTGCQEQNANAEASAAKTQEIKVSTIKVAPIAMRDVLTLPGSTEAISDVKLASDLDGRVEWIGPKEGESVTKGQLIAKVDVDALKAILNRAKADYALKQDLAKRRKLLHKRKALPQEDLDRALTEQLVAQQTLREAKVRFDQGMIHAPLKGKVNHLYVDPGEFVSRGNPVAEIVNVDQIRINLNVPEMDVRYIKPGQKSLVTIDAYPGRKWLGQVDFVAYKADEVTKTFKVRIVVDNTDKAIRPGMIARASLERKFIKDAIAVPMFAIQDKGGERVIFVEKDGIAHARTIEIGVLGQDKVQITKGLEPGENLIVTGQNNVEDGIKVQVQ